MSRKRPALGNAGEFDIIDRWATYTPGIPAYARLVLIHLLTYDFGTPETRKGIVFPSQREMAKKLMLCRKTIGEAFKTLQEIGAIQVAERTLGCPLHVRINYGAELKVAHLARRGVSTTEATSGAPGTHKAKQLISTRQTEAPALDRETSDENGMGLLSRERESVEPEGHHSNQHNEWRTSYATLPGGEWTYDSIHDVLLGMCFGNYFEAEVWDALEADFGLDRIGDMVANCAVRVHHANHEVGQRIARPNDWVANGLRSGYSWNKGDRETWERIALEDFEQRQRLSKPLDPDEDAIPF